MGNKNGNTKNIIYESFYSNELNGYEISITNQSKNSKLTIDNQIISGQQSDAFINSVLY